MGLAELVVVECREVEAGFGWMGCCSYEGELECLSLSVRFRLVHNETPSCSESIQFPNFPPLL